MRILTCLKQVRHPESLFSLEEGRALWPEPGLFKMSACDEFALEEGLSLKDALAGSEVWAVSLGPARAEAVLRRALGMGADQAALLLGEDEPPLRPARVAAALAEWARPKAFDLVLTGVMSEDAMQGTVGPMLAELLGLACATSVVEIAPAPEGGLRVLREMEGGRRQALKINLPALLTVQSSARAPRYPTLSALLKAKKATIASHAPELNAGAGDRERLLGLAWPGRTRAGLTLEGDTAAKADRLYAILRERALL